MLTIVGAVVGSSNGELITDENGRIVIPNLEPGITVTAKEIRVPDGVVLDSMPKSILIEKGMQSQTLRFVNQKTGYLVVRKLDKVSKQPLSGVEFELTYAEGGYVDDVYGHLSSKGRFTTNDMGEIRVPVVGTVVVKEVTPCPGYIIDEATKIQTVTVNPADTQTITVYNEPLCSLTLTKLDAVTQKPVPNTEFTLRDGDGNILGRYTTGSDGTVTVTGLIPNSCVPKRPMWTCSPAGSPAARRRAWSDPSPCAGSALSSGTARSGPLNATNGRCRPERCSTSASPRTSRNGCFAWTARKSPCWKNTTSQKKTQSICFEF